MPPGLGEESASFDPDDLPMTPEMIRRLRPFSDEEKGVWSRAVARARGRPPAESPKLAVSMRLDQDVVEHFKSGGPGWQSRINTALRKAAKLGRK